MDLRLLNRVLTPRERLMVQVSPDPDRMLWSLWAAKEAAWKALVRQTPGIPFAPAQFEVLPDLSGGTASVLWQRRSLPVIWRQGVDWVHAWTANDPSSVVAEVGRLSGDLSQSVGVRTLATEAMVAAGYPPGSIDGQPPWYQTEVGRFPVSLSHDGPYGAAVFRTWTTARPT